MRKSMIIILLVATAFASCKNTENKKEKSITKEEVYDAKNDGLDTSWMKEMQLNNDSKWEANIETTEGVKKMQEVLKVHPTNALEEYHDLVAKLNVHKNYIIKECTMEGDSHDYLHVWLLPLLAKLDALSEAKTIKEASKIKQSIEENINAYYTYFE